MLAELRVENLGIVDDLTLALEGGLVAITGETGAGKTLIVEAVELLVGGRADPAMVRAGASEARVEGRFVLESSEGALEHVLARVVPAEGRSRAYLDGRLATAAELATVGRVLIDLHGQHSHQSLLAPATQRAALDAFAGSAAREALEEYRSARAAIREIDSDLETLGGDPRALAREIDLLRFQLEEINTASIEDPDEDRRIAAEIDLLADVESNREALGRAIEHVEGAGRPALGAGLGALRARSVFAELAGRLDAVTVEIDELVRELHGALEELDADPARLDQLQDRRRRLQELRRKYGPELADVVEFAQTTRARLEELEHGDERRDALLERRELHSRAEAETAERLHEIRARAAAPLAEAVSSRLRELALPHARIEVDVARGEPGDDGADTVEVRFAADPGEPLGPLTRVASGGELARTMLALRLVLTAGPPTLVFDEVDAGIGGEAGSAVGRSLARLATTHQVLCVTHLAQVAAFADAQVAVSKRPRDDRAVAEVARLDGSERIAELSRMLAGVGESRHAREHAAELLEAARRS